MCEVRGGRSVKYAGVGWEECGCEVRGGRSVKYAGVGWEECGW